MAIPDLNLLVTLDVLLAEGSVAGAARRLGLSPSAMSRALARLRETTGDPLLVRAGRGLVPTPRAVELRERVSRLVEDGAAVLRPAEKLDLKQLVRTFTLRTSDGFVENFGPDLIARVDVEAPGVRLRFMQKPDKDSTPLRDGSVDLETGVVGKATGPEVHVQALFRDRLIGAVRIGHALGLGEITAGRYAAGRHIGVSRRGLDKGPIDDALEPLGLERQVVTIVGGFASALALARASDLIASVPDRHTGKLRAGMHSFRAAVRHSRDHDFDALAPAAACRSGASLAARVRAGCLRGAALIKWTLSPAASVPHQLAQPVEQDQRQQFGARQQRIVVRPEHQRQVVGGMPVDGQAERRNALQPRFGDGLAHVFDAVAAVVLVDIVRLAVGEQQQQAMHRRLGHQRGARVADGGAGAGVVLRLQAGDAQRHAVVVAFAEVA